MKITRNFSLDTRLYHLIELGGIALDRIFHNLTRNTGCTSGVTKALGKFDLANTMRREMSMWQHANCLDTSRINF